MIDEIELKKKLYLDNTTSSDGSESALSRVSNMSFRNCKTCFGHEGDHTKDFTEHFR